MSNGTFVSQSSVVPYTTPHRFWRVVWLQSAENQDFASVTQLQFFSQKGHADQVPDNLALTGWTGDDVSDTTPRQFTANNAFSGTIPAATDATIYRWIAPHPTIFNAPVGTSAENPPVTINTAWIGQDFGQPRTVQSLGFYNCATPGELPSLFNLDYSDDGANWTTLETFSNPFGFAPLYGPAGGAFYDVSITVTETTEVFVPSTDLRDYLSYIPPLHAADPYFRAELNFAVENNRQLQLLAGETPRTYYDLDGAVGPQLDRVGERVGISRTLSIPIVNVFFTFGDARRGFGLGVWQTGTAVTTYGLQSFDDDTFRNLIKAKVIANAGDGSIPSAELILSTFLADTDYLYSVVGTDQGASGNDRCGAVMTIGFSGTLPPLLYMIAIEREIIPLRPAGVKLKVVGTTVPGLPCFGFGVSNAFIGGFGNKTAQAFRLGPPGVNSGAAADPAVVAEDTALGFGQGYWNGSYLNVYTSRSAWARKPEYLAQQGLVS